MDGTVKRGVAAVQSTDQSFCGKNRADLGIGDFTVPLQTAARVAGMMAA
jgi:hypothetical protein